MVIKHLVLGIRKLKNIKFNQRQSQTGHLFSILERKKYGRGSKDQGYKMIHRIQKKEIWHNESSAKQN